MRVLLIGATGTIGRPLAEALAAAHEVIAITRKGTPSVDLGDPASIRALYRAVGPVDAVVSTAGAAAWKPLAELGDEDFAFSLANKLMGQVNLARFGAPFVRDGGAITLTTGVLAQHPMPGGSIITTVNAAVEGFVRAAAVELGDRVRVNAVSPGWITETLQAMGMDPTPGLPAAQAALSYVQQIESGASGSIVLAARQG
jgi:NAD(P)-dependent dehydrogenase (short-subunit alcohol dehydrogenase family)